MLNNFFQKIEKGYASKVNSLFISLGGINKTFQLESKTVTFAIVTPSKFNLSYFLFKNLKDFYLFKKIFSLILRIPYFFTETFSGSLLISTCTVWAFIGREPITAIFCLSFVVEFCVFLIFMGYYLRLEGVYDYCIKEYGGYFVEKYIG